MTGSKLSPHKVLMKPFLAPGLGKKRKDLKTIQELLGDKSFEMTLRYAHLSPEHKNAALDILCKRLVRNPKGQHGEARKKYPGQLTSLE
ncbi:MAG TPA: hypothetical protein ENI18_09685 [Candidatus Aminicenantes bacterium]|nr:hypothetical protein [Candidatus Aminicenantes bacterium]